MIGRKSEAGVTLLELMIGVLILAIALVAMITTILNAMHLETQSQEIATARTAAELQMESLRGMTYTDLITAVETQGDGTRWIGGFGVDGLRVRPVADDPDQLCGWFQVEKRAGAVGENLLDITVRVEWLGRNSRASTVAGPVPFQQFELLSVRSDRGTRWQGGP